MKKKDRRDRIGGIVRKVLKIDERLLDTSEPIELKRDMRNFQTMAVMDHCELYLADLINKEQLISILQDCKLDNFQITKLITRLNKDKVL